MEKKPTLTNTKAEILDAYNDLLKKKESESNKNPKEQKAQEQKEETVKSAASLSAESIVKGLTDIKLNISYCRHFLKLTKQGLPESSCYVQLLLLHPITERHVGQGPMQNFLAKYLLLRKKQMKLYSG